MKLKSLPKTNGHCEERSDVAVSNILERKCFGELIATTSVRTGLAMTVDD